MAPKHRLFQARFSATLLRSAALAISLLVPASPTRAEVVTLICQNEFSGLGKWGSSFTLRIDYDRKIVDFLLSDGTVALTSVATISESDVRWYWDNSKWDYESDKAQGFMGGLNRLSGEGWAYFATRQVAQHNMSGPCRRATQKF